VNISRLFSVNSPADKRTPVARIAAGITPSHNLSFQPTSVDSPDDKNFGAIAAWWTARCTISNLSVRAR